MLHDERRIVSCEILSSFQSNVMKDEGTDDAVHSTDAELMYVLRAKPLRNSEQKLNILSIGRIPRIFGLRPIVVHSASQSLQR